jgi:hypothetical protein
VVATSAAPEAAAPEEELGWAPDDEGPGRLDPPDPVGLAEVFALLDAAAELDDREGLAAVPDVEDPHPAISTAVSAVELYLVFAGRGWTPAHWEQWTITTLTATLLR